MPIKSYIATPLEGQIQNLAEGVTKMKECEIIPATNKELLVIVTDTPSDVVDEKVYNALLRLPSLQHLTLVSGFNNQEPTTN